MTHNIDHESEIIRTIDAALVVGNRLPYLPITRLCHLVNATDISRYPAIQAHLKAVQTTSSPYLVFVQAVFGDRQAIKEMMHIASHDGPAQTLAIKVLGFTHELRVIPVLLNALNNGSDVVAEVAAVALGMLRHSAAVPDLSAKLTLDIWRRNSYLTDAIEEALRAIGSPEAIAALAQWHEMKM